MNELTQQQNKKKYFAIIPYYIVDHLSATEQAVYLQIKRRTGEDKGGLCYASDKLMKDKLKIGSKALKKARDFLITSELIIYRGKKLTMTNGGPQNVNVYSINNDIWGKNNSFYSAKGVSKRVPLESKRGIQMEEKGASFGQQRRTLKEETIVSSEERERIIARIKKIREQMKF